jgi:hypothetical protein
MKLIEFEAPDNRQSLPNANIPSTLSLRRSSMLLPPELFSNAEGGQNRRGSLFYINAALAIVEESEGNAYDVHTDILKEDQTECRGTQGSSSKKQ